MDLLRTMEKQEDFDGGFIIRNLIQFCFSKLLQDDHEVVVDLWNRHRIRSNRNTITGREDENYVLPGTTSVWNRPFTTSPGARSDSGVQKICYPKKSFSNHKPKL
ncbi:uncharacterized protein LOC117325342 [Pecten maximus]|uniref:uncharacterized protein LOC117325342 n=1 Tax=Pecten maximus TaxID=6579 RepID=UPI001458F2AE|nr:uncharacterized protein LOC117325342 [Pecten maximus]